MLDIIEFLFYCFNVRPKATTTNYLSLFLHRFCIEQTVYILKKVCEKKKKNQNGNSKGGQLSYLTQAKKS